MLGLKLEEGRASFWSAEACLRFWGGEACFTRWGFIVLVLLEEGSAAIAGIELGKPTQKKAEASLTHSKVVRHLA